MARSSTLRRFLLGTALAPAAALASAGPSFAQAVNLGRANNIVPDGRTATSISVRGTVTNVRTSTFAGGNAYNSFSTFQEAAGNTVNLYVPKQAHTLVNIVRNGAVDIQGTLNSYQNNKIGGNVVFADSYGFVVGKSGVINTGGLTIVTPNNATIDAIVDRHGNVNQALAAQMIAGNVPLSADGSVVIAGGINAQHFVRITAQDVRVAGSMAEARRVATRRAQFESTVNTQGLREGGSIVVRNGAISIVAAGNATISGNLTAGGSVRHGGNLSVAAGRNTTIGTSAILTASASRHVRGSRVAAASPAGPSVSITAGDLATIAGTIRTDASGAGLLGRIDVQSADISIAGTATLAAEGTGSTDGGRITVKATGTTDVAAGAVFLADATGTGNGGSIEISGAIDKVDPAIVVDLDAARGNAGSLLFDPDVLIIGGTTQGGSGGDTAVVGGSSSTLGSLYTNGGNIELDANTSIEIAGTIDTRAYQGDMIATSRIAGLLATAAKPSTGNSGAIILKAPSITIDAGGALYADVYNTTTNGQTSTWTAGAITLGGGVGQSIAINGTVAGGPISANATGAIGITGSVLGGATTVSAGSSIALATGAVVDTRVLDPTGTFSIADSQSITFTAPTITTASGSQVRSGAIEASSTTYASGAITFDASSSATGSIDVAGLVSGGATTFTAGSSIALEANALVDTRAPRSDRHGVGGRCTGRDLARADHLDQGQ